MMYRDFDLFVEEEHVGEAISIWVLTELESRRLLRLSDVSEFEGTDGGELCRSEQLHKPRTPEERPVGKERRTRWSETDNKGHVNNGKYAEFVCDALSLEALGQGTFVSSLQLGYLAECLPGEEIFLYTGGEGRAHFALGRGAEGKERFQAILTLDKLA